MPNLSSHSWNTENFECEPRLIFNSQLVRSNIFKVAHPIINHVINHVCHILVGLEKLVGLLENSK